MRCVNGILNMKLGFGWCAVMHHHEGNGSYKRVWASTNVAHWNCCVILIYIVTWNVWDLHHSSSGSWL